MTEQLSPLTRRIVAIGLLVLVLLILVQWVVVPIIQTIGDQRDDLATLRNRHARLVATAKRLLPDASTMPPGLAIGATDSTAAGHRLQALLAGSASIAHVALSPGNITALPGTAHLVGAEIVVGGTEAEVTRFVSLVEHGSPALRFRHWRLSPREGASDAVQFSGQVIAAWEPLS